MKDFLSKLGRWASDRTTWMGLALIAQGVGSAAKIHEAQGVADALSNVGNAVSTGGWPMAVSVGLGALLTLTNGRGTGK